MRVEVEIARASIVGPASIPFIPTPFYYLNPLRAVRRVTITYGICRPRNRVAEPLKPQLSLVKPPSNSASLSPFLTFTPPLSSPASLSPCLCLLLPLSHPASLSPSLALSLHLSHPPSLSRCISLTLPLSHSASLSPCLSLTPPPLALPPSHPQCTRISLATSNDLLLSSIVWWPAKDGSSPR